MNLRLACADFTFPLLPHHDVFKLIAMLGLQGVDIGVFEGRSHLQPSHVLPNLAASARELSAKVHDQGLEFADIFYQTSSFETMAANHPDAGERRKSRELFQRLLEFTLRCNALHMTALPGIAWEGEPLDASLKRCAEELAWRAEQARQAGVVFSVEAHVGSLAPTPATARQLVEITPGLTLTLDYTHFIFQGFSEDECETLVPYASHFHARGACPGRLQAPFKENTIDYPRVLRAMQRVNYPGYVGLEYTWSSWQRCDETDNVSETILLRDQLKSVKP